MGDNRGTEYRAKRMGFVFQSYNPLPVLSAAENVELPGQSPRRPPVAAHYPARNS